MVVGGRMNERMALALRLKRDGRTLREIGNALGVSRERARALVLRAQIIDAHDNSGPDTTYSLSARAQNVLESIGLPPGCSRDAVMERIDQLRTGVKVRNNCLFSPLELQRQYSESYRGPIYNLGIKTLSEIESWLGRPPRAS